MIIGGERGAKGRWAALAAAVCTTLAVHARMDTASAAASGEIRVPDPARARALALGFEPVIADWYWLQAIQVVGGQDDPSETHGGVVGDLVELVTTLDPWVDHPYRFAGLWLTGSPEDLRRANRLLEKGISYHPLDWRNRFYLGFNTFFYLQQNERAAEVLESAAHLEGAPDYLGAFATRLRASANGLETALLFLEQLLRNAPDEGARQEYLRAFDEIETERRARYLDRARIEFWHRHGRDVRAPSELWEGPLRVMERPPPAHPRHAGATWRLDEESGEIVSSYYGDRYRVHVHAHDAALRAKWREEMEADGARDGAADGTDDAEAAKTADNGEDRG